MIRFRHIDPKVEDNTWVFNPQTRRCAGSRRKSSPMRSAPCPDSPGGGGYGGVGVRRSSSRGGDHLDPDSYFGFSAKIEDYNYKYLGEKNMLALVHAKNSPEVGMSD